MGLIAALILDAILGEPPALWSRVPHPAVLMGRAVAALQRRLNRGGARRLKGVAAVTVLVVGTWAGALLIAALPLGPVFEALGAAVLLAQRSLVEHVSAVARGLRQSLDEGRRQVAMIVGRDTGGMDAAEVARAAIESAAENFSDGVVAPALWFALGGLPGIAVYKVVNTADSMIGYHTPELEHFGWAAARLDDVLNWIPARVAAVLIAVTHGFWDLRGPVGRDAALHRSPNAGWPEAAMARALGVALAGPRSYHGRRTDFPYVNAGGRHEIGAADIDAALRAVWRAWAGLLVLALVLAVA